MKKHFSFIVFALLGAFSSKQVVNAQSGNFLDFAGTASNEHVNLGNPIMGALGTTDFTVEMWVKPESFSGDPSILSNKDWNSGNNVGIVVAMENTSDFTFNWKPSGGTRRDINITVNPLVGVWHHLAVVVERGNVIKFYHNGILGATSANISADAALSIAGSFPLRLGQDGTGTYGSKFDGKIDEFRIWTSAKTQTEIRDNMCKSLTGNEANLLTYHRLDNASGSASSTDATTNAYNGTLTNMVNASVWLTSDAPVGDASAYNYPATWPGQSVTLTSANAGSLKIDNVIGTVNGIHIYRVDNLPNTTSGVSNLSTNNTYFGIFADGTNPAYDVTYDYNGFSNPVIVNENILVVFNRDHNADNNWTSISTTQNTVANTLVFPGATSKQGEYILGNVVNAPCNAPSNLNATSFATNAATASWTTGGSSAWNIQYGPTGFTLGTGTIVTNVNTNPYTITGLNPSTTYDVYVKDTCLNIGSSAWVGPVTVTTLSQSPGALGAGYALDFDGNNDYVDCSNGGGSKVSAASLNLPTTNITLECWVKPRAFGIWKSMVGFLQDNGSTEAGWDLELRDNGRFGFSLQSTGGSGNGLTYMETPNQYQPNKWYHVAGTYDGSVMKLYVNGVLETTSTDENGAISYLNSWLVIGEYKDDNENWPIDGQIDEVRVWNTVRTQAEIRDYMCEKLIGNETGLVHYWRLDDATGTTVTATTGTNGVMMNMASNDWLESPAPIGDDSQDTYQTNWTGQSLLLSSVADGSFSVYQIKNQPKGIHIYRVDGTPSHMLGVNYLNPSNAYFGVFVAEAPDSTYGVYNYEYNYTNYPTANTNENNLILLNRPNKTVSTWAITPTTLDIFGNVLYGDSLASQLEFVPALNTGFTCLPPTNLYATAPTFTSSTVVWTSGGSPNANLEYGSAGFALGTGTAVNNTTANQYNATGLSGGTLYAAYVQDTCLGSGASVWYGPLMFTTQQCASASNLNAINITASSADLTWSGTAGTGWQMQWGPAGFTFGFGIIQNNITTLPYTLSGLAQNTSYDYYIRNVCGGSNSAWVGPFTFTTGVVGINEIGLTNFNLSPNPSQGMINIAFQNNSGSGISLNVYNLLGELVYQDKFSSNGTIQQQIDLSHLEQGMYHIELSSAKGKVSKKLILSR